MQNCVQQTSEFLQYIGLSEEPLGIYYADTLPEKAYGPKVGAPISCELEKENAINWEKVWEGFSCFMGNIWLARKKNAAAFISMEQYGCVGGGFYTGMYAPYLEFIPHYVSTGIPNTPITGERYMKSPDAMRNFLDTVSPAQAPAKYCIAKPLSHFSKTEKAEVVVFFARPEVLSGLYTHVVFTTGDMNSIVSPFGAGCTSILSWALHFKQKGEEKAVLGGFDPSARKFFKTDELSIAMPLDLYRRILKALPESVFHTDTWKTVSKKIERSKAAWKD